MPVLPGDSQPLALTAGGAPKKKAKAQPQNKGKGRGARNKVGQHDDAPQTPKVSRGKRKGDDELIQIDLKRKQLNLRRYSDPWVEVSITV